LRRGRRARPRGGQPDARGAAGRSAGPLLGWSVSPREPPPPVRIYLDHNASSPLRDEVAEAMAGALRDRLANPSTVHAEGAAARAALELARERVAALAGSDPDEVVFTSGASEANHAALHGVLGAAGPRARLVTTTVEHPSVEEAAAALEAAGHPVARVP